MGGLGEAWGRLGGLGGLEALGRHGGLGGMEAWRPGGMEVEMPGLGLGEALRLWRS